VLGPARDGKSVRFRVPIDGKVPGADRGTDIDAGGNGTVNEQRLYQFVRLANGSSERTFEIRFLGPGVLAYWRTGVLAYAFTFG
jgi:hypothetical protein